MEETEAGFVRDVIWQLKLAEYNEVHTMPKETEQCRTSPIYCWTGLAICFTIAQSKLVFAIIQIVNIMIVLPKFLQKIRVD